MLTHDNTTNAGAADVTTTNSNADLNYSCTGVHCLVGWNEFFFICSYDEACLVVRESPAFLAFEGHKGRKAKKGKKKFFCQMTQNCPIQRELLWTVCLHFC